MNFADSISATGHLEARVVHANGTAGEVVDLGSKRLPLPIRWWALALLLLLAGVTFWLVRSLLWMFLVGVVTTAGVNYMAADFLTGSGAHIDAFQYHDCGTGTTAESISQTALVTPAGSARVAGTGSNPSANIYKSVATITPGSALAITEWGLFSASTVGTMWDRRVFSAINVGSTDSIQFTYQLTITAGG
jgi:hypothetical protein